MAWSTASGTPRRFMSFNTGGNVSKVQGEDLMARMIASSGTRFWTIVSTSLLLSGVISVSPGNAAANEGVRMRYNPTASGKNAFFTANSFQSSGRLAVGHPAGTSILTESGYS